MELHEQTAKLAYELWEKRGRQPGKEWENWYEAEIIIRARHGQSREDVAGEKAESPVEANKTVSKEVSGIDQKG